MKKTMEIIFFVSCMILMFVLGYKFEDIKKEFNKGKEEVITDAIKFKNEYEGLNGKVAFKSKDAEFKYPEVKISKDNAIKYSNASEVEKVMDEGTGVIYLGYAKCPWCRSAVPALLQAAEDAGIENVYYIDMENERDEYAVEDGELVLKDVGTNDYQKLLKVFDKYLDKYVIEKDGKKYKVGEKRIYVPMTVFVREGEVVGIHIDTVESQKNPFNPLNDKQFEELYNIYSGYMHEVLNDLCDERC